MLELFKEVDEEEGECLGPETFEFVWGGVVNFVVEVGDLGNWPETPV